MCSGWGNQWSPDLLIKKTWFVGVASATGYKRLQKNTLWLFNINPENNSIKQPIFPVPETDLPTPNSWQGQSLNLEGNYRTILASAGSHRGNACEASPAGTDPAPVSDGSRPYLRGGDIAVWPKKKRRPCGVPHENHSELVCNFFNQTASGNVGE